MKKAFIISILAVLMVPFFVSAHGTNLWEHFKGTIPSVNERALMYKNGLGLSDTYTRSAEQNSLLLSYLHNGGILGSLANPPSTVEGTSTAGWTDDGSNVRLNTAADFVGIGTANPTEKLTIQGGNALVSGTISLSGGAFYLGSTNLIATSSLYVGSGGFLGVSSSSPNSLLTVNGTTSVGVLTVASSTTNINGVRYTWPSSQGSTGQVATNDGLGGITWSTPSSATAGVTATATAGMTLANLAPTFIATSTLSFQNEQNLLGPTGNTTCRVGANGEQAAQSSVASTTRLITGVTIRIRRTNLPPGNLIIEVRGGPSGVPGVNILAASTTISSSIGTSLATTTFTFQEPAVIPAGTEYWIVIRCSTNNDTDFFNFEYEATGNPYPRGNFASFDGSSWTEGANADLLFILHDSGITQGQAYVANAAGETTASTTMGFNQNYVVAGQTATIQMEGGLTGFSGLTAGSYVWLNRDATSTLIAATGTMPYRLGYAVSSSQLIIETPRVFRQ